MSYYYNYYIGYIKNNKIYPWGPYNANNKLQCALSKSRSYASDLHYQFSVVPNEQISSKLRKQFEYKDFRNDIQMEVVRFLPVKDLPSGSFIQKEYFLISDVIEYEKDDYNSCDYFYERLTPQAYAAKLEAQLKFGPNQPNKDGYTEHNASEYMYYVYPDFNSIEYESFLLRSFVDVLRDYNLKCDEYVILETEG